MIRFPARFCAITVAAAALATAPLSAQEADTSAANDPTAPITSYQFQNYYTPNFHNDPAASANRLQFRAAVPFTLGNLNHIFRVTVPYQTETATGDSGFGDITIFDLVTFEREWGRFGVGAVALLPTGSSGLSTEKWGIGPAAGFVAQADWGIWGLFNQNVFTVAGDDAKPDVDISIVQPILNLQLGNGWSVGTSEMTATYDWNTKEWVSLPLGVGINKIVPTGGNPWQLSLTYERNFADTFVQPRDTIAFTAKLLVTN
ncbi:hypothetical protein PSA7680_00568 [Pseudoruegeria aquimaris]|uniref:MetA-pathway of phenol degradation n=1 Tax=Pseudoruegeria aquimaris TaxID=393663 RepID=A0A1Y5RHL3_9RHOB|nr:hypothetical protein [Pseudoruegeria aquimaris]SLN17582.1 hypothetical protein PSA7680_00568 [Pseudoruegeria aquimaris]